jgi:hypothetical protein
MHLHVSSQMKTVKATTAPIDQGSLEVCVAWFNIFAFQELGAKVILYSSSNFACASSFLGTKVTAKSSLSAKTLSLPRYLQSLSKICVVNGL